MSSLAKQAVHGCCKRWRSERLPCHPKRARGGGGFACKAMLFFSSNGLSLTRWKGCFGASTSVGLGSLLAQPIAVVVAPSAPPQESVVSSNGERKASLHFLEIEFAVTMTLANLAHIFLVQF
ncbi:hypothetical protein FH972_018038 [Carpinus fangiana]|uniref:Uncharacterized protein n=1 Tax=Carpinus fangiana TaxID=176857 RepID=A0A5N6RL15_9ROSI|nr:hypothetical protein FH972_018038 [Carpinus fangiana]